MMDCSRWHNSVWRVWHIASIRDIRNFLVRRDLIFRPLIFSCVHSDIANFFVSRDLVFRLLVLGRVHNKTVDLGRSKAHTVHPFVLDRLAQKTFGTSELHIRLAGIMDTFQWVANAGRNEKK
jgi:hypothetical protein